MTDEEKYLKERIGQRNPFRTPDGYFDQFADQLMARLPNSQPSARRMPLRRWLYAAACFVGVLLMFSVYHFQEDGDAQQVAATETYLDEVANYAMMDNSDIYLALAEDN